MLSEGVETGDKKKRGGCGQGKDRHWERTEKAKMSKEKGKESLCGFVRGGNESWQKQHSSRFDSCLQYLCLTLKGWKYTLFWCILYQCRNIGIYILSWYYWSLKLSPALLLQSWYPVCIPYLISNVHWRGGQTVSPTHLQPFLTSHLIIFMLKWHFISQLFGKISLRLSERMEVQNLWRRTMQTIQQVA